MSTKKYAVIGHPIGHSLSPFIHENLFKLDNIDAKYIAIDIDDLHTQYDTILKDLDGYNVTIPYKQDIITKINHLSPKAQLCNSVNTVKNLDGKAYGYTTDGYGFLQAVKSKLNGELPADVLIYGCGGVARAISFECIAQGCNVRFAVRSSSLNKCKSLIDEIYSKLGVLCEYSSLENIDKDKNTDLIVNGTPVGMYPYTDGCVASDDIIKKSKVVFDAVYNPLETTLLKKAESFGKKALGSIDMLVYQAAKAHEIWVGATYDDTQLQLIYSKTADKLRDRQ